MGHPSCSLWSNFDRVDPFCAILNCFAQCGSILIPLWSHQGTRPNLFAFLFLHCRRRVKIGQNRFQLSQNGSKWAPKGSKGSKCVQKRVNLYQNALNWVPSGLKWYQHELKWVKMAPNAVQRGPTRPKGVKMWSKTGSTCIQTRSIGFKVA